MEPKNDNRAIPVKIRQPRSSSQYHFGAKGLLFLLLAIFVLVLGFVGYLEFDRLVEPYMDIYLCCIPAIIIAGILIFFGFAARVTTVSTMKFRRRASPGYDRPDFPMHGPGPGTEPAGDDLAARGPKPDQDFMDLTQSTSYTGDKFRKFEAEVPTKSELHSQKQNLKQFLSDLDEQHRDGLIMDGTYFNLRNKYNRELNSINQRMKKMGPGKGKKVKKKKK